MHHLDTDILECSSVSSDVFIPASKHIIGVFCDIELSLLARVYSKLYPNYAELLSNGSLDLPSTFKKMYSLTIGTQKYYSEQCIRARKIFPNQQSTSTMSVFTNPDLRVARVKHFAVHSLEIEDLVVTNAFAIVEWVSCHPGINRIGKPYEIYCSSFNENDNDNYIIPLDNNYRWFDFNC